MSDDQPKKITEMWAWVVTEADGGEGVPASNRIMPGHFIPLVGADEERVRSMQPHARGIADMMGLPLKLVRFTSLEVVEVIRG